MTWNEVISPVLSTPKLQELKAHIKNERATKKIYPEGKDVFRAFDLCGFEQTRIVILGQDPYATPGAADGLAFSSRSAERPKSLEVIFKELYNDLNIQSYHHLTFDDFFPTNSLENWATKLGILLLNTVLTVEEGKPNSHRGQGWETLTSEAINALNKADRQIVFFLWGKEAQAYKSLITNRRFCVFEAPHPAAELHNPNGDKFTGCRHFSILRDIYPDISGADVYRSLHLDSCFDKAKAKELALEHYPMEAEKLCEYIDHDLFLSIPVNREKYYSELRRIELSFSTKLI